MSPNADFVWSAPADAEFRACPRLFWFQRLAPVGREPRERTTLVLRSLRSRRDWADDTVRNAIRWILDTLRKNGAPPAEETALQLLGKRLQKDFTDSGEGLYWDDPAKIVGLLEHEYDERDVSDEEWQEVFEHALVGLSHFYSSTLPELRQFPSAAWLDAGAGVCEIEGVRIAAQIGAAFRQGDDIIIFKWDTKSRGADDINSAALFAAQHEISAPNKIVVRERRLDINEATETRFSTDTFAAAKTALLAKAKELTALRDAPEKSFALSKSDEPCSTCRFVRICPKFNSPESAS